MNKTPLLSLERRRSPRKKLKTSTPTLEEEESPYPEEIYQSQVPQEDGIYWAYDNPKLDEELHRKVRALDDASPTCRKKARIRSTPKLRLKIAGSRRRNNNNDDEEAKEFLNQCFGDFIKKNKENSDAISDSIVQINETKDQGSSNLFDDNEDEDEFLLLASQAIDSSVIKKTPLSLKKDFNRKKSTDHFEDDSFDVLLSQLPEDVFNKSTPKSTKLTLKRHGTSEDIGTPRSSKSTGRNFSFRRNNSAPIIESPPETIPCTQEEIMRKKGSCSEEASNKTKSKCLH
ncbi:uncharacterized protein [Lepeophtheirus salmonis]|uniref:uncharacterized protein n=1 Tax=Lepeophtheirus salmonis TaxID=72036 RepID=UPI001AEA3560|nr:uncharacterized protein LOC121124274 [Lepeophtheirus salmonis]XP_040575366.1 uncharacterized protein LOC121124274 [Lepeophtheirus salmonis]XP_040575367.1 uncharacterized protein LOC121124274 [Lepeophtheirus salmonis]XP_040575368.1 uncharacterized protein LOC121124274 [Lepeophtheirus salmonis]